MDDGPISLQHLSVRPSLPNVGETYAAIRDELRGELIAEMQGLITELRQELKGFSQDADKHKLSVIPRLNELEKGQSRLEEQIKSFDYQLFAQGCNGTGTLLTSNGNGNASDLQDAKLTDSKPTADVESSKETTMNSTPSSMKAMNSSLSVMTSVKSIKTGVKRTILKYSEYVDALDDMNTTVKRAFQNAPKKKSWILPGLRIFFAITRIVISLLIWTFLVWGLYKITLPQRYFEIQLEREAWVEQAMPLPDVAFDLVGEYRLQSRVRECIIRDGDYSTKSCEWKNTTKCYIRDIDHADSSRQCLDPELRVLGAWGDPIYRYVEIQLIPEANATLTAKGGLSLSWRERLTLYREMRLERLYSFSPRAAQAYEIFYRKVIAIEGSWVGIVAYNADDDTQELLLNSQEYLKHGHEYSRSTAGPQLSVFLRADSLQVEEFYECYSILRMLEAMGGLWTALSGVMATFVLILVKTYTRAKQLSECC